MAIFVYIFVAYILKLQNEMTPVYTQEALQKPLWMGISVYGAIYIVSAIAFVAGYIFFDKSYNSLLTSIKEDSFDSEEERKRNFQAKYTTIMLVSIAIFESIVVMGLVLFLVTLDLNTMIGLAIVSSVGFFLVMPTKSKFDYHR